jgi:hypothetical protein
MGRLFFLISFASMFVWAQTAPSSVQPFSITISGPTEEVRAGKSVEIKIRLTNTSNHELNLPIFHASGMNISYNYDVRDNSGSLVEKKNKGQRSMGSSTQRVVEPGESVEDASIISRVFDIDRPGQYVIQVSRTISGDAKDVVKSNSITIKVIP